DLGAGACDVGICRLAAWHGGVAALLDDGPALPRADLGQIGGADNRIALTAETLDADRRERCYHRLVRGGDAVLGRRAAGHPTAPAETDNRECDGADDGPLDPGFGVGWHIHGKSLPRPTSGHSSPATRPACARARSPTISRIRKSENRTVDMSQSVEGTWGSVEPNPSPAVKVETNMRGRNSISFPLVQSNTEQSPGLFNRSIRTSRRERASRAGW